MPPAAPGTCLHTVYRRLFSVLVHHKKNVTVWFVLLYRHSVRTFCCSFIVFARRISLVLHVEHHIQVQWKLRFPVLASEKVWYYVYVRTTALVRVMSDTSIHDEYVLVIPDFLPATTLDETNIEPLDLVTVPVPILPFTVVCPRYVRVHTVFSIVQGFSPCTRVYDSWYLVLLISRRPIAIGPT